MPAIKPTWTDKELICKAADLQNGESLFIEMKTHKQQMTSHTQLTNAAREYVSFIDTSISLTVAKTFQDGKLWIKITKDSAAKYAYILQPDGTVRKEDLK